MISPSHDDHYNSSSFVYNFITKESVEQNLATEILSKMSVHRTIIIIKLIIS